MVGDESRPASFDRNTLSQFETLGKVEEFQCSVTSCVSSVQGAAIWLAANPDKVVDPRIPFVRQKFELSITQAVEALKQAHALSYGGGQ